MSMVMELIAAVTAAERRIDEQLGRLVTYQSQIDEVTARVEAALAGSTQNYNTRMIQQLNATKQQIDQTVSALQAAKEQLLQVRMV